MKAKQAILGLAFLIAGCGRDPVRQPYAVLDGDSINGIGIFQSVLKSRGYQVEHATLLRASENADLVFCFDRYGYGLDEQALDEFMNYTWERDTPTVVFYIAPTYLNNAAFWKRQLEAFPDRKLAPEQQQQFLARQPDQVNGNLKVHTIGRKVTALEFATLVDPVSELNLLPVPVESQWTDETYENLTDYAWGLELLTVDDMPYATMRVLDDELEELSGVVLVANPFLFMNYALVDDEARLALDQLLDNFEYGERAAIIDIPLAQGASGDSARPLISTFLATFPVSLIALQGLLALALYFWRMAPIQGYGDRERVRESISFGRHVTAFARKLKATGRADVAFAIISRYLWRENPSRSYDVDEALEELDRRMETHDRY